MHGTPHTERQNRQVRLASTETKSVAYTNKTKQTQHSPQFFRALKPFYKMKKKKKITTFSNEFVYIFMVVNDK